MNLVESVRLAFGALLTNKLRALLTMLGIIIGVGSVIGLLAMGAGFQQFLNNQFSTFGVGVFYVAPFVDSRKADEVLSAQLTAADAAAIARPGAAPAVKAVSVEYTGSATVSSGSNRLTTQLRAVTTPAFAIASDNKLIAGRLFTDQEDADRARVVLLNQKVARDLFGGNQQAIGERISINGAAFDVVGILDSTIADGPPDPNAPEPSIVTMPYETAKARLFRNQMTERVDVSTIQVQARSAEEVDEAVRQVTNILRERHRLTYQNNDFTILNLQQLQAVISGIIATFSAFLAIIGGISLLVGGIGVMNIMLVSVTERTREIGLRKAVGARQRDILAQFLIEAMVMSLVGGFIGILLGFAMSLLGSFILVNVFQAEGAQAQVTAGAVLLATGVSAAVGICFGLFPALQAARMNPIEALRYE